MNIDELKVGELKQLTQIATAFCANDKKESKTIDGGVRIVILQRGWVVVGRYSRKGQQCKLHNGYVIRKWGTNNGLPEIAENGPTANTVLDKSPDMEWHQLTEVFNIQCAEDKWLSKSPR